MKNRVSASVAASVVLALLVPVSATAHPDHSDEQSGRELFPGEGVETYTPKQHGEVDGHLPAVNKNIKVVGRAEVSQQGGSSSRGRVADVSAYGDYAYLTSFRTDDCLGGGAWVVDMSDPANPVEDEFLPTTPGNYAGEGSQVITAEYGPYAGRQLFLHQNEVCNAAVAAAAQPAPHTGGMNIWDVTDPENRQLLVEHAGDMTPSQTNPHSVHSVFAWNSHVDKKVYAVLVDNDERADVDIMDITDPANPVMVNDSLDLVTKFQVQQASPSNLTSIFNHDMMVYRMGDRYVMNVNYWDGGYVLLDVTDPRNVSLVAESDYAALDEQQAARGKQISPEGNAHQSEFSPDFDYMVGTDEDFNPFRVVATITSGAFAGTEFSAVSASGTPPIDQNTSIKGTPDFVGQACGSLPAVDGGIALIERGVCSFQVKLDNIRAAGYDAGIVFNSAVAGCDGFVRMLAEANDTPFIFVQRSTGLKLLGVATNQACSTATPGAGTASAGVNIEAIFDGWGYVRLFRTSFSSTPGTAGSIAQIGTYAIPESQDPEYATGYGDLSVHEVAMDPRPDRELAYLSYYSGGVRVLEYSRKGLKEVGAFIDEGGSNVWGIEVHEMDGETYLLASDRDHGLYVLQYQPDEPRAGHNLG